MSARDEVVNAGNKVINELFKVMAEEDPADVGAAFAVADGLLDALPDENGNATRSLAALLLARLWFEERA